MRRKPWDTRLAAWTPFAPGWVHTVHWTNKLLSKRTRGKEMTGNLKGEKPLQNGKSPPSSFPLHSLSSTIDLFGSLDTGWHLFYFIPLLKYLWCDFMSHPILSRPKNNYDRWHKPIWITLCPPSCSPCLLGGHNPCCQDQTGLAWNRI